MISVALATYNGEKYIREQLESIINQDKKVDEIIVFDDASTDATLEIINKIKQKNDINIIIKKNTNNFGYIKNFRNAIQECSGDYIFIADQDDIWEKNKVSRMIDIMQKNNIDILASDYQMIDESGNVLKENRFRKYNVDKNIKKIKYASLLFGNKMPGCTYCFTKKLRELYLAKTKNQIIHDYALSLIGSITSGFYVTDEKLIKYRIHDKNVIGVRKKEDVAEVNIKVKKTPYLWQYIKQYSEYLGTGRKIITLIILYLRLPFLKKIVTRQWKIKR